MSHDTVVHRLVRPAVRLLAGGPVRPDHLTMLRLATALAASVAFASGQRRWLVLGAAVFLVSALLDRADGTLARLTRCFSQRGHRLDLIADCSATVLTFLGLGWGARHGPLGWGALALGILAGCGAAVLFWESNVRQSGTLPGYAVDGRVLVDPDDGMLALPVILWCFGPEAALLPAGLITPGLALWMVLRRQGWQDAAGGQPRRLRPRMRG